MAIHAALYHRTEYHYDRAVTLSPQVIRLRPAAHCRTPIESYALHVSPQPHFINWQQDPYGNFLARVVFPEKVEHFRVEVDVVAEMAVINPFDFFLDAFAEQFPFTYPPSLQRELAPFLESEDEQGERFEKLLAAVPRDAQATTDFLVDLNQRVQQAVAYTVRMEAGIQTPEETLTSGKGSCRDSAWLLAQLLRRLGLASRFCSGYLIQLAPDIKSLDGPSGPEKDFTDLHAWTEVYLPGAGWVGLDPTSGLFAGEGHIPLACSPHPLSAAPISGSVEKCETTFHFDMNVRRLAERPRVTRPFSDDAWQALDQLGKEIDERLEKQDVRLTMGGEPTFISIDDMDGEEWNIAAVGPRKRELSEELLRRLADRYAPGAVLHYGQGKWYPGESLPRWALTCYWRRDGEPLWRDRALLAATDAPGQADADEAQAFTEELTDVLGVERRYVQPAYEDVFYYLWKEQKLPDNVDPLNSKLDDPEERARLARVFSAGLNKPRGFVLPLQYWQSRAGPSWISGPWPRRQGKLMLIPGDSPIGLRLPLETLPWVSQSDYPYVDRPDPTVAHEQLPGYEQFLAQLRERFAADGDDARRRAHGEFGPREQERHPDTRDAEPPAPEAREVVRTALCAEPRHGHLHFFIPPLPSVEAYAELLAAIETVAARRKQPVVIEGEAPPADPRLNHFRITPDPGVIEVNVHPSASWNELVEKTESVYAEARETRLGTDKFMLDGRHTGTGGGNHIVLGASKPLDSPFLRRPDLLRSMLAYWQAHPSLSYLFASLFIGPTSQSPRIDEARNDALDELELAFAEVERAGSHPPPWLVDRIFRHLLTDMTGNTHRAEFCIDKLYSPDSSSGRLGLLELRSFEMPPHARMSLAQQLLVRGLIAWFWENPWPAARLVRWGHDLQDRMLLPHFLTQDLWDVLDDLNRAGMAFSREWYHAQIEFRFPRYGEVSFRDMTLELRQALEPWHVLGEEGYAGGTVRFVDSSVERLEIKINGLTSERYRVACNGCWVPLRPTGKQGEYVAGVRYRAWQPPSCLHPTIPVDTPLVFDLVDTWSGRAVAGCTYHVGHPGGRNYETFPVNAFEAESRRLARFQPFGHTPGPLVSWPRDVTTPSFPATLDLRHAPKA